MRIFFAGEWRTTGLHLQVTNPFDGAELDTVPIATPADIDVALKTLEEGVALMRRMTPHERATILRRTSELIHQHEQALGRTISSEEGKVLSEGLLEASRARETFEISAEEAKRLTGEMIPLEGAPNTRGKLGFTLRVPCGIVAAITPFNFPLNLVAHKVGPAIAAGNAVIIKPASDTPLSALKLVEILLEAGLPPQAVACVVGSGSDLGRAICTDPRVRKISFTGSFEVGETIAKMAGVKKVTLELGSNAPVIVMDDADIEKAASMVTVAGYINAGQICISAQRILTAPKIHGDFLDCLRPKVAALTVGDQLKPETKMGPMIRERDAQRVESWVQEAVKAGASVITGGKRHGAIYEPTIVADVAPTMRISCEELFGPAVAVTRFKDLDEAIRLANDTRYGLSASLFTQDIDRAMRFVREVDSGNLHINSGPNFRADLMPYGGLKNSGIGKEGPHYAVREMSEEKMVVLHLQT